MIIYISSLKDIIDFNVLHYFICHTIFKWSEWTCFLKFLMSLSEYFLNGIDLISDCCFCVTGFNKCLLCRSFIYLKPLQIKQLSQPCLVSCGLSPTAPPETDSDTHSSSALAQPIPSFNCLSCHFPTYK